MRGWRVASNSLLPGLSSGTYSFLLVLVLADVRDVPLVLVVVVVRFRVIRENLPSFPFPSSGQSHRSPTEVEGRRR
jgi:hypothetical protein